MEERPTFPLPNMLLTQSDTHIANFLFRNRTWFTMSDLNRPHLALISRSATERFTQIICWHLKFLEDYEPIKTTMQQQMLLLPFKIRVFHFTWHFPKMAFFISNHIRHPPSYLLLNYYKTKNLTTTLVFHTVYCWLYY